MPDLANEPVVPVVTRAQLAIACALPEWAIISAQDAEDWAAGSGLPQPFRDAIDADADMTAAEKLTARIEARTRDQIRMDHPLVGVAQNAFDLTNEQKAALFDAAAAISG